MPDNIPGRQTEQRPATESAPAVTDELVKKVADKVYAMMLRDLAVDSERHHPSSKVMGGLGDVRMRGGW